VAHKANNSNNSLSRVKANLRLDSKVLADPLDHPD
jgi:hypothetical protein